MAFQLLSPELTARKPNAITSPGTASGTMDSASSRPRTRIVERTTTNAMATPSTTSKQTAIEENIRLLRMLLTVMSWPSAATTFSADHVPGRMLWYQLPGAAKLVSTTPRCGSSASPVTSANGSAASHARPPVSSRADAARLALLCMA